MENKISYLSISDIQEIKNKIATDNTVFLAEIDGKKLPDLKNYLQTMGSIFQFPILSKSLDGYNDWMRDLSWLGKEKYVLIIYNYKQLLSEDTKNRNFIIEDFKNLILPWWEKEIIKHVVQGKPKPFNIYLVDDTK